MHSQQEEWARRFRDDGFVGPVRVMDEAAAALAADRYARELGPAPGSVAEVVARSAYWERTRRWVYDLATRPALLDVAAAHLGDVVLFGTSFWPRGPGEAVEVDWHADGPYWHMNPRVALTAWVSLTESYPENSGLLVARGSHRRALAHADRPTTHPNFRAVIDPADIDPSSVLGLRLRPGEAVVFTESLAHASGRCADGNPRLAFTARYCSPASAFPRDPAHPDARRPLFVVRGADRHRLNDHLLAPVPAEGA